MRFARCRGESDIAAPKAQQCCNKEDTMYAYKDPYILDFRHVKSYDEVHKIIREAFDFPDYYGENWSAFWDCLTDMVGIDPIHVQIFGLERFRSKFPEQCTTMLDILERLRHYNDDKYIDTVSVTCIE